jgi:hypothetical protein
MEVGWALGVRKRWEVLLGTKSFEAHEEAAVESGTGEDTLVEPIEKEQENDQDEADEKARKLILEGVIAKEVMSAAVKGQSSHSTHLG